MGPIPDIVTPLVKMVNALAVFAAFGVVAMLALGGLGIWWLINHLSVAIH